MPQPTQPLPADQDILEHSTIGVAVHTGERKHIGDDDGTSEHEWCELVLTQRPRYPNVS